MSESRTKIFGAGLSKTGTTSLQAACTLLGYRSLGFHVDRLGAAVVKGEDCDFRAYDDYDAVFDLPVAHYYQPLMQAYPRAKFILSLRDEDDWWASIKQHFEARPARPPKYLEWPRRRAYKIFRRALRQRVYGAIEPVEGLYRRRYREHNDLVQSLIPADRLLVINLMQGDGWPELCGFLGLPEPAQPFPYENRAPRSKVDG